ncbi:MAG: metallophosphoesterase [Phototrophicales bacterium]|nr:metallophosphoesterase [Phototrophicales bacterium]
MPRIAWLTDIHLEFLNRLQLETFLTTLATARLDALWITGDIGQASNVHAYLNAMLKAVMKPIYFVLGNHDYYHGSIPQVRDVMTKITHRGSGMVWLPATQVVEMTQSVGLVGHDGWSDGRYGDFMGSNIMLNDYHLIKELNHKSKEDLLIRLQALADDSANHLRGVLPDAATRYSQVFVLLHPPPFMEVCYHKGKQYTPDNPFLPHFSCKAVGDVLLEMAHTYPTTHFTVLCGHTHGGGEALMRPNLRVLNGMAEYRQPQIQRIFEFS